MTEQLPTTERRARWPPPHRRTEIQNFIDGEQRAGRRGRSEPILNPATGEQIATAPLSGEDDVDAAVQAAKRAFQEWSRDAAGRARARAAEDRRRARGERRGALRSSSR